jgi:hypothetical protein
MTRGLSIKKGYPNFHAACTFTYKENIIQEKEMSMINTAKSPCQLMNLNVRVSLKRAFTGLLESIAV